MKSYLDEKIYRNYRDSFIVFLNKFRDKYKRIKAAFVINTVCDHWYYLTVTVREVCLSWEVIYADWVEVVYNCCLNLCWVSSDVFLSFTFIKQYLPFISVSKHSDVHRPSSWDSMIEPSCTLVALSKLNYFSKVWKA